MAAIAAVWAVMPHFLERSFRNGRFVFSVTDLHQSNILCRRAIEHLVPDWYGVGVLTIRRDAATAVLSGQLWRRWNRRRTPPQVQWSARRVHRGIRESGAVIGQHGWGFAADTHNGAIVGDSKLFLLGCSGKHDGFIRFPAAYLVHVHRECIGMEWCGCSAVVPVARRGGQSHTWQGRGPREIPDSTSKAVWDACGEGNHRER